MNGDYGKKVSNEWLCAHKHYTAALLISYGGTALNSLLAWFLLGRGSVGMLLAAVVFAGLTVWTISDKRYKSRCLSAVIGAVLVLLCVTLYFFVYKYSCSALLIPLAAECSIMIGYAVFFKSFKR